MAYTVQSRYGFLRHGLYHVEQKGLPDTDSQFVKNAVVSQNYVTKGDNIPNWRWRIANGIDATTLLVGEEYQANNPFWAVTTVFQYNKGTPQAVGAISLSEASGTFCDGGYAIQDPASLSTVLADNAAKTKFVAKCREVQRSFQGGVFLGELRQTLRMIRNPAKALREGLQDYLTRIRARKGRLGRGRARKTNARKFLADTWLEYSYGWRPLLSDVEDGAKALANLQRMHPLHQAVSAYGEDVRVFYNALGQHGHATASFLMNQTAKSSVKVIYRGAIRVNPSSQPLMAQKLFGVSLTDFVPTAWELVPYSFLVDYFTNIGNIIDAWSFGRGNLSWSNQTVIREYINSYHSPVSINHSTATTTTYQFIRAPTAVYSHRLINRQTYLGNFIPVFQWQLPGSSTKWINLGALLASKRMSPYY